MFRTKKHQDERLANPESERIHDDSRTRDVRDDDAPHHAAAPGPGAEYAYRKEEFGGLKGGAVFYGWLVAVAFTILLIGIVSAIATGIGSSLDLTQSDAELRAGEIGVGSAIALLVTLAIGYFAGGYVAGRLARFNGARQGVGVWVLGLIITIAVVAVGAIFGEEYNVFDRVELQSLPIQMDELTAGGVATAAAVLIGTLIAAVLGGGLGQRYHSRIDRTTLRD